jgi:GntR family transcriptional repressor for pyruvate dehydrogenase complex
MAVTDEAILKIKDMILSGTLNPGDRLPPEKELSESLGLSRNSLREAVKALEVLRVLNVKHGDGTFVTSLEPRLLLEAMTFVVDLHTNDAVLEMFAVRRILEPAAANIAANRLGPEGIASLRAQLKEVVGASDVDALVEHDTHFHATIVHAAGNAYLESLIASLSGQTTRARLWRGITQQSATTRTLDEHTAIVDALEAGDGRLAETLTAAHIYGVEQWIRQWSV